MRTSSFTLSFTKPSRALTSPPQNSFHEQIVRCRAAENTCYFATVNYASEGSPTTTAIAKPDGTWLAWQPYGVEGILVADIETEAATGLLARRYEPLD